MGGMRRRLKKLEEALEAETVGLRCRECGEEMTVHWQTDTDLICWEWAQGVREEGGDPKTYRPTPPDVFVITEHPCGWDSLEVKATGESWPFTDRGGGRYRLTIW